MDEHIVGGISSRSCVLCREGDTVAECFMLHIDGTLWSLTVRWECIAAALFVSIGLLLYVFSAFVLFGWRYLNTQFRRLNRWLLILQCNLTDLFSGRFYMRMQSKMLTNEYVCYYKHWKRYSSFSGSVLAHSSGVKWGVNSTYVVIVSTWMDNNNNTQMSPR
jgi:hypothetical protein